MTSKSTLKMPKKQSQLAVDMAEMTDDPGVEIR